MKLNLDVGEGGLSSVVEVTRGVMGVNSNSYSGLGAMNTGDLYAGLFGGESLVVNVVPNMASAEESCVDRRFGSGGNSACLIVGGEGSSNDVKGYFDEQLLKMSSMRDEGMDVCKCVSAFPTSVEKLKGVFEKGKVFLFPL